MIVESFISFDVKIHLLLQRICQVELLLAINSVADANSGFREFSSILFLTKPRTLIIVWTCISRNIEKFNYFILFHCLKFCLCIFQFFCMNYVCNMLLYCLKVTVQRRINSEKNNTFYCCKIWLNSRVSTFIYTKYGNAT